ncbi:MAG: hypothetical protein O7H39_15575, partial [Gammaproteobacteria bacterium]|nr:hypothetical protein [Gammaproteobacteria bacterium]
MTNQQQEQVVPGVRIGANASTERRRRLKNYLIKSKFQLKFSYYMIAAGFAFFGATVYFVEKKLTEIDVLL